MRRIATVLAITTVAAVAGCGEDTGSDGGPSNQSPAASPTATEKAREKPATPACRKARRALVDALESSLTISGGGGLRRVSVVEVIDPPSAPLNGFVDGVYAVAAELTGQGMDGTVAVWAASRDMIETGGGLAFGADSVTREFSELGAAASGDSPAAVYAAQIADSEAGQQARACAEG